VIFDDVALVLGTCAILRQKREGTWRTTTAVRVPKERDEVWGLLKAMEAKG
jgi:hypothetical protein